MDLRQKLKDTFNKFVTVRNYTASTPEKSSQPRGGTCVRKSFMGIGKLEVSLWKDRPENVVMTRVTVPAGSKDLIKSAEKIRAWVTLGKL